MDKNWKICEPDPRMQEKFCEELGITASFAQLLLNRGIRSSESARMFLFGDISSCYDPSLMKDLDKGVSRILSAVEKNEKILIYGDYDVDGVTSSALLAYILGNLKADYKVFIPNRLEDGYGMNVRAVAWAREHGVDLIITVDCGINSFNEVKCANDYGIDVIVTDHHELKDEVLPPAFAVIDPHRPDCDYPYKGLAGVGVAYKVARALMKGREHIVDEHLDLVALGTVADVSPMDGENRILVREGLKHLANTKKSGLKALMESAYIKPENLTCRHIGFGLAPRINAMGRVGSANMALDLLMSSDAQAARSIAQKLEQENKNRQAIEKDLLNEVSKQLDGQVSDSQNVIVLAGEAWHVGVLGIVASRLSEKYDLPTILISIDGEKGKGSGRSAGGVNLFESINEVSSHLMTFGGHEAACGLKIKRDNIDDFRDALNTSVLNHISTDSDKNTDLKIDLNIPFSYIGVKLVNELKMLMPFGQGNIEPVFATNSIVVKNNPREVGRTGFKFLATCGNLTCEAITFKKDKVSKPRRGNGINLAYTPSINSCGGIDTIHLNIKDLQILS